MTPTPAVPALVVTLLQVPADTVYLAAERDLVAWAEAIGTLVVAVSLLAVFLVLVRIAVELRRRSSDVMRVVKTAEVRLEPVIDRLRNVAENADFVSRAIREDMETINASVARLGDRLNHASDRMEERVEEFNALMEVVQSEAESVFIETAATVRGVRAGARSLRRGDDPRSSDGGLPGGGEARSLPHGDRVVSRPLPERDLAAESQPTRE